MLTDGTEHRCQLVDISAFEARLRAPIRGRLGEHVICYLERYGRMEGRVTTLVDDGFVVEFSGPALKREKLALQLARQSEQPAVEHEEPRLHERLDPVRKRVVLRLADGRHIAAQLINLSRSGAALTCPVVLAVGDALVVGRRAAHVARITQRLVGVAFETEIAAADFTTDIVL